MPSTPLNPNPSMNYHRPVRATGIRRAGPLNARKLAMLMAALAASSQLAPVPVVAQAAATGSIQGRVMNAANGMYLNNARITVDGTSIETFTNEFGDYSLSDLPEGEVTLRAAYTGQEPQTAKVKVEAGKTITQNISFNADQSTTGDDGMIILNEFVVASDRFKNAQEIATNEERFSTNIKSVVATDSLGFVPGGNVGELVKFLPGVQVGYGGSTTVNPSTASSIEVRGFGSDQTTILIDGMPVSSANAGSLTRETGLDTLSINNASRVEITKVATPDMPAESAGGTVNLITKSAFEVSRPTTTASVYLTTNTEDTKLSKQAGPTDKKSYHTLPSGRLSVMVPFSDKLGATFSISSDNQYAPTNTVQADWTRIPATFDATAIGGASNTPVTNAKGETSSLANPYLGKTTTSEYAWTDYRLSGNVKLDWKPFTGLIVNTNVNYSSYKGYSTRHALEISASTPMDWGPDYTIGRLSSITSGTTTTYLNSGNAGRMTTESFDKESDTLAAYLKFNYTKGPFAVDGRVSRSTSNLKYVDIGNGHFSSVEMSLNNVGQVRFDGINNGVPAKTTITRFDGSVVDHTSISSWTNSTVQAGIQDNKSKAIRDLYNLDVRYQLDFLPFDVAVKTGFSRDERQDERWGRGGAKYLYVGANGLNSAGNGTPALTAEQLLDPNGRKSPGYGLPAQEWASVYTLYKLYAQNPSWFSDSATIGLQATNLRSQLQNVRDITETNDAYYGMIESKLFNNRLNLIAGARQTQRKRVANQSVVDTKWNYVKNPDGSVYKDSTFREGIKFDFSDAREYDPNAPTGTSTYTSLTSFNYLNYVYNDGTTMAAKLAAAGAIHPGQVLYGPNNTSGNPTQATSSNNLEAVRLAYGIKKITAESKDPVIPQVQGSYRITDKLVAKASWSREVALPRLESSVGGILTSTFNVNEFTDPTQVAQNGGAQGQITMSNAGLDPQKTQSYNFELAYYFNKGGKISVSYYYKQIENIWETITVPNSDPNYAILLNSIGLDPALYPNYVVSSTINGSRTAKNTGYEIDVRQNLEFLGRYGRYFNIFANYSHKDVKKGNPTNSVAQILADSADDTYNGGIQFATSRLQIAIRGNYIAENLTRTTSSISFNGLSLAAYDYTPEEYRINVQLDYNITKRYTFFISANNVLNSDRKVQYVDAAYITPSYASTRNISTFGVTVTTGINAKF